MGRGRASRTPLSPVASVEILGRRGPSVSHPRTSEERAIAAVRRAAEELGVSSLKLVEYREWSQADPDAPSEGTIQRILGTWNRACALAGLQVSTSPAGRRRQWTPEMVQEVIRELHEQGQRVTVRAYNAFRHRHPERRLPSPAAITVADVSFSGLVEQTLSPVERMTKGEARAVFRRLRDHIPRAVLSESDYETWRQENNVAPSWSDLRRSLGQEELDALCAPVDATYFDDEIVSSLRRCAEELGADARRISWTEYYRWRLATLGSSPDLGGIADPATILRTFDKWDNALATAGLPHEPAGLRLQNGSATPTQPEA